MEQVKFCCDQFADRKGLALPHLHCQELFSNLESPATVNLEQHTTIATRESAFLHLPGRV